MSKEREKTLILCASFRVRRLWLKALLGSTNIPKEKFLGDAIPTIPVLPDVVLAGPVFGAPSAAFVAEHFLNQGFKRIVLVGMVGGISSATKTLEIGDIVFPRRSFPEDGVTALYSSEISGSDFFLDEEEMVAGSDLSDAQKSFEADFSRANPEQKTASGGIWTTDCPSLETPEKIAQFLQRGASLVDMEFSAVSVLAKLHRATLLVGFVVSDLVGAQARKGFSSDAVEQSLALLADSLTRIIQTEGVDGPL